MQCVETLSVTVIKSQHSSRRMLFSHALHHTVSIIHHTVSVLSSRWLHRPPGHHNPSYSSYEAYQETALITPKALFKSALCPADVENEGWVTSSVSNVHFSRLWLPNISHTCHQAERREGGKGWGSAERIRTTQQIPTSCELRASVDDVTTQRDGIPQWHFKCNTRARQRSLSEPKDGKQQWPCGRIFLTGVIIFRGQTSIIAQHTNNKTVQAFFKA